MHNVHVFLIMCEHFEESEIVTGSAKRGSYSLFNFQLQVLTTRSAFSLLM